MNIIYLRSTMQLKKWLSISFLFWLCMLLFSCQKELSCEGPTCRGEYDDGKAVYSFVQRSGECINAVAKGSYLKSVALDDSNHITVQVHISKKGVFNISTDTVNGFYFNAKGSFADTTVQSVVLKGNGKPLNAGNYLFTTSKISGCNLNIRVDTLPIIEKYYYDVTIDGKRYQQTVGNGIIMRNTNALAPPIGISSYIGTDGPFTVNDSSTNNNGLYIYKRYIQTSNITLSGLASFFSPGPQVLFPFSSSGNSDGIGIDWNNIDAEPVYDAWKSYAFPGTQTGSSFVITSVETYADAQGRPIAKVKANFNCILYNERGESKVLTNGKFYGEFANR